MIASAKEIYYI